MPGFDAKEQKLHKLYFETAGSILFVLNPGGIIEQINDRGCRLLEDKRTNIVGKNWLQTYFLPKAPDHHWGGPGDENDKKTDAALIQFESHILTSKGNERYIAWITDTLFDDRENVISTINVGYDITEDKHRQNELKKFRTIIDNSSDHILVVDPETVRFVDFNDTAIRELGYNREELFELGPAGIKPDMDEKDLKARFDEILASPGKSGQIITKHRRKNESILDVEINLRALQLEGKYYLLSIARNVTERKKYETIIRALNLNVSHFTGREYCKAVSKFLCEVLKLEKCIIGTYHPEAKALNTLGYCSNHRLQKNISMGFLENPEKLTDSGVSNGKTRIKLSNVLNKQVFKELGPLNHISIALKDEDILGYLFLIGPEVHHLRGLYVELLEVIAARCQSEIKEILADRSLKRKNRELELKNQVIESSLAPIITMDFDGIIHYSNPAFINLWGYQNSNEVNGRFIVEFFESGRKVLKKLRGVISQPHWQGELCAIGRENQRFEVQIDTTALNDEDRGEQRIVASFVDITERKEMERFKGNLAEELKRKIEEKTKALEVNQAMYKLISENMTDLVTICDSEGILTFSSPSVKEIIGYKVKEVVGRSILEFIHADDRPKICPLITSLERDEGQLKLECRVSCSSGKYKWVETTLKGIYNSDGKLVQIQTSSRDIMARKDAERVLVNALEKERHLGLLKSRFVSTASHQFRTPLTVIQSNIELLNMQMEHMKIDFKNSKVSKISFRIQREVRRMTDLMNDVLILGKINSSEMTKNVESINMVELLNEFKDQAELVQQDNRRLDFTVKGNPIEIQADRTQLGHAIMNLISNAFKYSLKSSRNPKLLLDFTKKQNLELLITDYGMGIAPSEIDEVFSPFYRGLNAEDVPGTGLGLTIVKEYIELNDGKISVDSTIEQGSTFKISIPKIKKSK